MTKQHQAIFDRLDPVAVVRYQITVKDIQIIDRYLAIIQANLTGASLWQEIIDLPRAYATSLVVHEIVEIRLLQARGLKLLHLDTVTLQRTLAMNMDAHIQATLEEHLYLQDHIARHYKQFFQVGTLLKVNRQDVDETDFQLLLQSDVGVFIVEDDKLEQARQIIMNVRGEIG